MKYNLRTLKGKRIVGGDPNLATKHEIHIDSLSKSDNDGGGSVRTWYYKWSDSVNETFKAALINILKATCSNATILSGGGAFSLLSKVTDEDSLMTSVAFKIEDTPSYIYDTYLATDVYIYNGSLWDRIAQSQVIKSNEIDPSVVEAAKQELGAFLVEITKEEWEAMITATIYEFKAIE